MQWTDGPLKIDIESETSLPRTIGGQICHQTTLPVSSWYTEGWGNSLVYKVGADRQITGCAVTTPLGTVAQTSAGTYIRFPGNKYAFRIVAGSGDSVEVIPVPGQKTAIVRFGNSASYAARHTYFFYSLPSVGSPRFGSSSEIVFSINSWPIEFTDQNNQMLEMSDFNFSPDGEWMIANVRDAIMRIHIKTKTMQTFAKNTVRFGTYYSLSISSDGQHAFVQPSGGNDGDPTVYDLAVCNPSQIYQWGQVTDVIPGCKKRQLKPLIQSAGNYFSLLYNAQFSYDSQVLEGLVSYRTSDGFYKYKPAAVSKSDYVRPTLDYLALGDSFASGEGDTQGGTWYEPGTDDSNNKCHLSRRSYSYLIAQQLGMEGGRFHSIACSGAVTDDILDLSGAYDGQVEDKIKYKDRTNLSSIDSSFYPGFISQIRFLKKYHPSVITISAIGNDIGFADKIKRCMMPDDCYASYEDRQEALLEITSHFDTLTNMYQTLRDTSPNTRIYVVGYPQIVAHGNCAANVHLTTDEIDFAQGLTSYLNDTISAAAKRIGLYYVDVENSLSGRRLCENDSHLLAVNGLTAGDDQIIVGNESFHPNAVGHQLMAQVISQQTDGLTKPMSAPDSSVFGKPIASGNKYAAYFNAPKTGRQINVLNYDTDPTNNVAYLNGWWHGVVHTLSSLPTMTQNVWLHSDPINLGQFSSDAEGNLVIDAQIPTNIEPGWHTLSAYGTNLSGQTVATYAYIFVAASPTDYDGDGTPNDQEACPLVDPSGIDQDKDSTDDACDGFIDQAPPEPVPTPSPPAEPPAQQELTSPTNQDTREGQSPGQQADSTNIPPLDPHPEVSEPTTNQITDQPSQETLRSSANNIKTNTVQTPAVAPVVPQDPKSVIAQPVSPTPLSTDTSDPPKQEVAGAVSPPARSFSKTTELPAKTLKANPVLILGLAIILFGLILGIIIHAYRVRRI